MLTQADLNRLDTAIASGQLTVQIGERRIQYHTVDELIAARRHVAQQISGASGAVPRLFTRRVSFNTRREGG